MKKKSLIPIFAIFFLSLYCIADELPKFKIMTEQWRPYNFKKNGHLQGVSVELFGEMLKKVGSKQTVNDIKLLPWPRAYGLLLEEKNTILFSMTRTQKREKLFKWVGPIHGNITRLFARKDKHVVINKVSDILKYKVGTIINDVGEQILVKKGIPLNRIIRVANRTQLRHMLHVGRIDLTPDDTQGFRDYTISAGYNPNNYESVYILNKSNLAFAFHKDTPDAIINKFQIALNQLKKDGTYLKILKKYNVNSSK